ncbi:MAG: 4Fe-4S binding protein, partial [Lachnospiraceae bacterium]|nr:4Fe-4S binding protein [Lachnospiraceae bacterium]
KSLMNIVYNQSTGSVLILENSYTGITGHQDHAATGKMLNGKETKAISLYHLCKAIGVEHVYEVDAFDIDELETVVKRETAREEVSVIIVCAPCALLKSQATKAKCIAIPDKCKKCGMCLIPGCPALTKNEDGTVTIDDTLCNGCGLCMKRCKFDAIKRVE